MVIHSLLLLSKIDHGKSHYRTVCIMKVLYNESIAIIWVEVKYSKGYISTICNIQINCYKTYMAILLKTNVDCSWFCITGYVTWYYCRKGPQVTNTCVLKLMNIITLLFLLCYPNGRKGLETCWKWVQ